MAHFKRGKCRYRGKSPRGSQASWRAKYGFKPAKLTSAHRRLEGEAWHVLWSPRGVAGNRGKRIGGNMSMMNSYPRWHDIMFHTRPRRKAERHMEQQMLHGRLDPEAANWPLAHKPHKYYW